MPAKAFEEMFITKPIGIKNGLLLTALYAASWDISMPARCQAKKLKKAVPKIAAQAMPMNEPIGAASALKVLEEFIWEWLTFELRGAVRRPA